MKRALLNLTALLIVACGAGAGARAQGEGGSPANWCRNGAFTRDSAEFGLARVRGKKGSRVHFQGEEEGCPGPAAKCRQKAYLVPGDEVLTSRTFGDWVCAGRRRSAGSPPTASKRSRPRRTPRSPVGSGRGASTATRCA